MDQESPQGGPEGRLPLHPGALLDEIVLPELKRQGITRDAFAKLIGVGRRTLYDLLDGKAGVTPEMALKLGRACGNGPDLWMALQAKHDLAAARLALGDQLEAIPVLNVPASAFAKAG